MRLNNLYYIVTEYTSRKADSGCYKLRVLFQYIEYFHRKFDGCSSILVKSYCFCKENLPFEFENKRRLTYSSLYLNLYKV